MALRLNQGIPWSKAELTGFALAVLGSGLLATTLMFIIVPETTVNPVGGPGRPSIVPNPARTKVPLTFIYVTGALLLLNYSPLKRLHGFVQYLACVGLSLCAGVADLSFSDQGVAMVPIHLFMGALWFLVFRMNWWFYWDNPSRRTIVHRAIASTFFTGVPFLGVGLALWRLLFRIGIHDPTTVFAPASAARGDRLETIIEDPALAEHVRRMKAIRFAQIGKRHPPRPNGKDALSGSI